MKNSFQETVFHVEAVRPKPAAGYFTRMRERKRRPSPGGARAQKFLIRRVRKESVTNMINPFAKRKNEVVALRALREKGRGTSEGDPTPCPECGQVSQYSLPKTQYVCPFCFHHYPIGAYTRLSMLLDTDTFEERFEYITSNDPYKFPGYGQKLKSARAKTGLNEAVVTGTGDIEGRMAAVGVMDSSFFMGSMSAAAGEKITLLIEYATKNRLPLIIFSASGGARMQEGILSLMQMAKTSAAIERFQSRGGLYISVLTHPTTGGVTASFASLGDIMLAEPKALIGFAGPRVIEQTIGETLPEGFQRSEYLLEHGFLDAVVHRKNMRDTLSLLLKLHGKGGSVL